MNTQHQMITRCTCGAWGMLYMTCRTCGDVPKKVMYR